MKHLKIVFLFLILFPINISIAQDHKVFYGLSSSIDCYTYAFTDVPISSEYSLTPNYSIGVVAGTNLDPRIILRAGLNYATKNITTIIDYSKGPTADADDTLRCSFEYINHYLDVPLEINCRLNRDTNTQIFINFGIVNSFLINHERNLLWTNEPISYGENSIYNDYLISLKFGLGLMLKTEKAGFYFAPQTRISINDMHRNYSNNNPIYFGLEVQILRL